MAFILRLHVASVTTGRPIAATCPAFNLRHKWRILMKRLHLLALAGAAAVWMSGAGFAQTTPPPAAQSPPSPSDGAMPPPARDQAKADRRQQAKAERKAQRKAFRKDCRAQGKQRSLSRQELRSFVKSCVAAPQ